MGATHFSGPVVSDNGIDLTSISPTGHGIDFSGMTLPASSNVIRGTSIAPTRSSGWVAFSGTLDGTSAYMDYMEMHTDGTDIIYGSGRFAFMDSGASAAQMQAIQAIAEVDAGATITTASATPAVGVFAGWFKTLLNGETFNSGGRAAVLYLGFQPNVTSVVNEDTSIINMGTAAPINAIFKVDCDSGVSQATHLFDSSAAQSPFTTWGADAANCSGAPDLGIRCKVGSSEYWIPLYINT